MILEVVEISSIMALFFIGCGFLVFLFKYLPELTKNRRTRQSKSTPDSLVKEQVREIQDLYQGQINVLKKEKQSLQNTLNRIRSKIPTGEEDEEDEIDMSQYVIDKKAAAPFLKNLGMNPEGLDSPIVQNLIAEKLKGNEELALMIGLLKPKSQFGTQSQTTSNQSDFDETLQKLTEAGQVA